MEKIKIGIVDDHRIVSKGIEAIINSFGNFDVVFIYGNGQELIEGLQKLNKSEMPDIITMDINMPVMNGYETTKIVTKDYPQIKILAMTIMLNEYAIVRMIKAGVCGYLLKNIDVNDFKTALNTVYQKGFFYPEMIANKVLLSLKNESTEDSNFFNVVSISKKETEFLQHCCEDLGYREIAIKMGVTQRTVEGYRDSLFNKLNIKTRVGLVMYAVRESIYCIE